MLRIKSIVENASIGDLVLLDELGGATDPDEGSALAMAIVDELVEKGVRVLITTHLIHLKSFALSRSDVMNVSVEFHPVTLKPTFRLLYDLPGESHAIETAERIGLSPNVINKAREYLDKSSGGSSRLMHELREKLSQVDELKSEWESRREVLEMELAEHRNLRDEVIDGVRREAQNLLRQSEKKIKDLQNSIKTAKSKEEVKSFRPAQVISEIRKEITDTLGVPLDLQKQPPAAGSRVLVKTWGRTGIVKDVLEGGKLDIEMGNLSVRVDSDDVEIVKGRVDKKTSLKNRQIGVHISPADPKWEINVIGLRVDEAIPIIDRAVDQALLGGLTTINVIHGKGTGRLKKAIWDHLTAHKLVRGIHSAKPELGGDGITVVEIDI
jgi:DNA mismatch repair protein MutS2